MRIFVSVNSTRDKIVRQKNTKNVKINSLNDYIAANPNQVTTLPTIN